MFDEADIEQMKRLFDSGKSKRQIALIMYCSEKTISNYLNSI